MGHHPDPRPVRRPVTGRIPRPSRRARPAPGGVVLLLAGIGALGLVGALGLRLALDGVPALLGQRPGDATDALLAVVGTAAAAVAAWLALGLVVCLLAALPGAVGRLGRAAAVRVVPATLRRTASAVLGGALLAGGLVPAAASAAGAPGGPVAGTASSWSALVADSGLSPDLVPTAPTPATSATSGTSAPSSGVPRTATVTPSVTPPVTPTARPTATPTATPTAPATTRAAVPIVPADAGPVVTSLGALSPATPRAVADPGEVVVVREGDCLWDLAAAHLPARADAAAVAHAVDAWFTTNRAVVGPDPDHIEPGQVLRAPDQAAGGR